MLFWNTTWGMVRSSAGKDVTQETESNNGKVSPLLFYSWSNTVPDLEEIQDLKRILNTIDMRDQ